VARGHDLTSRIFCQDCRSGAPALSQASNSASKKTGRRVPSRMARGVRPLAYSLNHCAREIPHAIHGFAVASGRSRGMEGDVVEKLTARRAVIVNSASQGSSSHEALL